MRMRCGQCRAAVDDSAEKCPLCGAPRTQFRMAHLGPGSESETPRGASESSKGERPIGTYVRVGIGITAIIVIFTGLAYYSKSSHLESVRRKCVATFDLQARCDCIVNEISKNTYAISFVPMFRFVSGLTQQKLGDIIRESAMVCAAPR